MQAVTNSKIATAYIHFSKTGSSPQKSSHQKSRQKKVKGYPFTF
jgi:hypothetical protein